MYSRSREGHVVATRELPRTLQKVLKDAGFRKKDITVIPKQKVSMQRGGGKGVRGFVIIINIATGKSEVSYGSWGGPNPFNSKPVDVDDKEYSIPPNGAVILGSEGGGRPVYATIYVNPETLAPILPAKSGVSDKQKKILDTFVSLKSSYRKEEQMRIGVKPGEIDELVQKGLLKRNRAGSTSITVTGKNALRESASLRHRGYSLKG